MARINEQIISQLSCVLEQCWLRFDLLMEHKIPCSRLRDKLKLKIMELRDMALKTGIQSCFEYSDASNNVFPPARPF